MWAYIDASSHSSCRNILEMTEVSNAKPLFFASDSEEDTQAAMDIVVDKTCMVAETSKKRLLFTNSDDENDDSPPANIDGIVKRRIQNAFPSSSAIAPFSPPRFASQSASVGSSSPPQSKKRKVTPPGIKKLKVPQPELTALDPVLELMGPGPKYIGSFLVPNAWSTCKGRGWVRVGEEICIRRNEGEMPSSSSVKSSSIKSKIDKKGSGKQLKLTSMMKVKEKVSGTNLPNKSKPDNVVRFTNSRGFGEWSQS